MKNVSTIWNKEFIMLFITNLLVLAAFYASIPIIPVYCVEIGITGSKVGIVLTAMSVATVLFRPVAGYLLDNFNLAQEKNIMNYLPYFYFCLVFGMILSKISTQKAIDNSNHRPLVYASLIILTLTMISFLFLSTGMHMLIAGFFFGLGYGILQPLFQSFVTGTTPAPRRGIANSTYMLSYDVGIGVGSLLMGFAQETIGLSVGFALTSIAYIAGGIMYITRVNHYYHQLTTAD